MKYALVTHADEDDAPGIVSTNWIDFENEICWFPNVITTERKTKLLLAREPPSENWIQCQVTIVKIFNDYSAAAEALRQAEESASLEIDPEKASRKRRKKYIFLPDDSSCDEDEPRPAKQSPHVIIKSYSSLSSLPELSYPGQSQTSIAERTLQQPHDSILPITDRNASATDDAISGIYKKIHLLSDSMREITCMVNSVASKMDTLLEMAERKPSIKVESKELMNLASLPIGNEEEFQTFNSLLVENPTFRQSLLTSLPVAGGKNVKALVFNILRKLMLDDIAEMYSLTGKQSRHHPLKKSFEKTEVYNLIIEVCLSTFSDTKEPAVREAVCDWLMQAKFRKSRRESRMLQNSLQELNSTTAMS